MLDEYSARLLAALTDRFGPEPEWHIRPNRSFGLFLFYKRTPAGPPLGEIRALIDETFNHRIGVIIGVKGPTARATDRPPNGGPRAALWAGSDPASPGTTVALSRFTAGR